MDFKRLASEAYKKAAGSARKPADTEADSTSGEEPKNSGASEGVRSPAAPKNVSEKPKKGTPGNPAGAVKTSRDRGEEALLRETALPGKAGAEPSLFVDPQGNRLSKTDIAKYLLVLGSDRAAEILKFLPDDLIESIVQEISRIRTLVPAERDEILAKFDYLLSANSPVPVGGVQTARGFLVQAFGPEKGEKLLRKALPEDLQKHFQFLAEYAPQQIQTLLKNEGTALKALVFSHLAPAKAAGVIKLLARDEQLELIKRMSRMGKLDRDVLIAVEDALKERIRKMGTVHANEIDGKGVLAEIMKNMDSKSERVLLEYLDEDDPELSAGIKERLFTIDTLLSIEDKDLQRVLRDVGNSQLALIMKGKPEEIRRKILGNLSQTRAAIVIDEYQYLGPKRRSEIDEATRDFVAYLKRLEEEGELVVRREDEEYI